jgi:hypothetical protein
MDAGLSAGHNLDHDAPLRSKALSRSAGAVYISLSKCGRAPTHIKDSGFSKIILIQMFPSSNVRKSVEARPSPVSSAISAASSSSS